ncbi:MAG TPA: MMPL family transporter, partial [Paracoccaceae bacterium]|nr:MMPL family transporter [Paracoccaceae bacterium]
LGLNVMLTLTALGLLGATLTLPGIAGIILCLGIAVDSNILIFSRVREETARGAVAIKALSLGYGRAWATILDANITTLLAMVLLFLFGAGAIRGFAVTMSLGILISMFTAVVLMRFLMETSVRRSKLKRLDIAPLFGGVPTPANLSFMRRGRLALALSAVLSVGSVALLLTPGPSLGIDFTGGVQMVLHSDAPVPAVGLARRPCRTGSGGFQPPRFWPAQRGADPRPGRGRSGDRGRSRDDSTPGDPRCRVQSDRPCRPHGQR